MGEDPDEIRHSYIKWFTSYARFAEYHNHDIQKMVQMVALGGQFLTFKENTSDIESIELDGNFNSHIQNSMVRLNLNALSNMKSLQRLIITNVRNLEGRDLAFPPLENIPLALICIQNC